MSICTYTPIRQIRHSIFSPGISLASGLSRKLQTDKAGFVPALFQPFRSHPHPNTSSRSHQHLRHFHQSRPTSNSSPPPPPPPPPQINMSGSAAFLDAVESRRSIYGLTKDLPANLSDAKVHEIVERVVKFAPSAFNSQTARLVVLTGEAHIKYWGLIRDGFKKIVPADVYASQEGRFASFGGAYGSIVFYEDPEPVDALAAKLPAYADVFPIWSQHTSAIHQILLWTALEAEGAGANLQHYTSVLGDETTKEWNIPANWKATAQLVFGGRATQDIGAKEFKPISDRVFYHSS